MRKKYFISCFSPIICVCAGCQHLLLWEKDLTVTVGLVQQHAGRISVRCLCPLASCQSIMEAGSKVVQKEAVPGGAGKSAQQSQPKWSPPPAKPGGCVTSALIRKRKSPLPSKTCNKHVCKTCYQQICFSENWTLSLFLSLSYTHTHKHTHWQNYTVVTVISVVLRAWSRKKSCAWIFFFLGGDFEHLQPKRINLVLYVWVSITYQVRSHIKHVENFVRFEICRFVHIHRKGDLF